MERDIQSSEGGRRHPSPVAAAVLGGATAIALVALSYLGAQLAGLPFVPFDVFDWLARVLPGNIITIGIDSMVNIIRRFGLGPISATAKSMEQTMGVLLVIGGGVVFGIVLALAIRAMHWSARAIGAALGVLAFLIVAGIEIWLGSAISDNPGAALLWLAILFIGWGTLLGHWLGRREFTAAAGPTAYDLSRRELLVRFAGGSIGIAIAAAGIAKFLEMQRAANGAGQALSTLGTPAPGGTPPSAAPTLESTPLPAATAAATTRDRLAPAPGTRPEVTENKDWYRTDIDTLPPAIDKATWKMEVKGLFDKPRALTLSDFLAYPEVNQPLTLSCISNPVGGDLISTGTWTGVRARDVLKDLGLQPQAVALQITSVDGFYESVPVQELMDPRTLFVYGMNGTTLPVEHGFPMRIYIPNHYGMKQPKWIVSIEAISRDGPGYWVDRGWSSTAIPQIVSVIDAIAKDKIENGRVPIGGIAYAGDRGIQKVEVQVDKGAWNEAVLRVPPLGPLTWVQWRYDWTPIPGTHTFRVRATDGTGAPQIETPQDTYPDGATGYHTVTVNI